MCDADTVDVKHSNNVVRLLFFALQLHLDAAAHDRVFDLFREVLAGLSPIANVLAKRENLRDVVLQDHGPECFL